jgi:hypothetical protein
MLESVEQDLAIDDVGDTKRNQKDGLRSIRVALTQGMLNQQLLTMTAAKRRGIIHDGEKFTIIIPGENKPITTELAQPGNRLKERGALGRLYKREELSPGDKILLQEISPGTWELITEPAVNLDWITATPGEEN